MSNIAPSADKMSYETSHFTSLLHSRLTSSSDSVRTSDLFGLKVDGICILLTEIFGDALHIRPHKLFLTCKVTNRNISRWPFSRHSRRTLAALKDWQLTSRLKCHLDQNYFCLINYYASTQNVSSAPFTYLFKHTLPTHHFICEYIIIIAYAWSVTFW